MNISPKERFLGISHFKRPGDLYMRDSPSKQTLEKWIEQGAPKEITDKRFQIDYFQFQNAGVLGVRVLGEIKSGLLGIGWREKKLPRGDLGHGYTFLLEQGGYFPRLDHVVPTDVTFENYCYYINLMREVAGLEKLSFR